MTKRTSLDRLSEYTEAALVGELVRLARELGKRTLSIDDIESHARCSYAVLKLRFGGLRQALAVAGLESPAFNRNVSDDDLLDELERIWTDVLETEGRRPFVDDLKSYRSKFSRGPYMRRWGSWIKACEVLERPAKEPLPDIDGSAPTETDPKARAQVFRPKRPIPLKLRYDVLLRDRFCCVLCGRNPAANPGLRLHVDHIVSESSGGRTESANLRATCDECNIGRGAARSEGAHPFAPADVQKAAPFERG